jgi:hypothetical protein
MTLCRIYDEHQKGPIDEGERRFTRLGYQVAGISRSMDLVMVGLKK